jgi:hypothetical protein
VAIVVNQNRSPRRPTTTSGTTRSPPARERGEKANDPKATGPVPGRPTSSRTTACADSRRQARSASANRSAPAVWMRIVSPQPTRPSPRRSQASGPERGSNPSNGPGSVRGTVRVTNGAAAGAVVIADQRKGGRSRRRSGVGVHGASGVWAWPQSAGAGRQGRGTVDAWLDRWLDAWLDP